MTGWFKLYTVRSQSLEAIQHKSREEEEPRLLNAVSLLWALCSQISFQHALTHFWSLLHSQYLSHSLSHHPLSFSLWGHSSFPLTLTLMHFQSACPLSRGALHVHQAIQKPACKWVRTAVHCKLLEISLEGERECKMYEKYRKKWLPAWNFYANESNEDKHYKGLTQPLCLFDVLMQWRDTRNLLMLILSMIRNSDSVELLSA